MSSLVEQVARAICINHGADPDMHGPGQSSIADVDGIPTIVSDHRGPLWTMFRSDAQAAINAFRHASYGVFDDELNRFIDAALEAKAMTDPLKAFRKQGEIDAASPLPVPINWKDRAEVAERERDELREALDFSKAMIDSLQETVARRVTERDAARAALEAKP